MDHDDWIRELAAADLTNAAPRADIVDRVSAELRQLEVSAARDWVSPLLVALATVAAGWLVCLAIPAWRELSMPITTIADQFIVVVDATY